MTSDPSTALAAALARLGESSRFVASDTLGIVLPGLEVEGAGEIAMPVSAATAKRLIRQAAAAPYGRGEETILDPGVRRTWQIEPDRIRLRNPEWERFIDRIAGEVRAEFGITRKVEARLYKLLIYAKGSFFAAHRDSEKSPDMFATLVVCLPSRHAGGQLTVTHDGRTVTVDFGGDGAEYGIQYAAFYADCLHEVAPVTAGHRVCLVYNLLASRGGRRPRAPRTEPVVKEVADVLSNVFDDEAEPLDRVVVPLAHQYTQEGFHPAALKGGDRARADVLLRAAGSLDCLAHLALMTHWQSGEADYATYVPPRRDRYGWYEDDEPDDANVEIGYLTDEEYTLDHWFDADGDKIPIGPMHIQEQEIIGRGDSERPYTQTVHGPTGNEGVSVERWYREAVVVIWPRSRHFALLASEGQASAIPVLARMTKAAATAEALEECREFAEDIIDRWQIDEYGSSRKAWPTRMLRLLLRLEAPDLVRRFVDQVLPRDFRPGDGRILSRICDAFGWPTFAPELTRFFEGQVPDGHGFELTRVVSVFESLCCERPRRMTKDRRRVCAALAGVVEALVIRCDARPRRRGSSGIWMRPGSRRRHARAGVPDAIIRAYGTLGDVERLDRFHTHVVENGRLYPLRRVLIPSVRRLRQARATRGPTAEAARRLRDHCTAELRALTARPVEPPADWSRDVLVQCTCDDCTELNRFLLDPSQPVHRFKARKDRRMHLHRQIDRYRCDVTHVTERRGSPQTLVCTKTQASYERRRKRQEGDLAALRELGG